MASWRSEALLDVLSQEQTRDIGGSAPGVLQSSLRRTVTGANEGDRWHPLKRLRRVYNFYCSMPILFIFHILLATFYTIFGTNILIQCPVPVPVCCMFYVSQKPHIKRIPNGVKAEGDHFWNIYDFWEEKPTRGGDEAGGRAPDPHGPPVR